MAGTYKLLFCLKRNAASLVLTILGGGDTQTLLAGKEILNFMHSWVVGPQKLSDFPSLPDASTPSINTPYEPPGETFTT